MASHFLLLVASAVAPAVANAFQLRSSTDVSRGNIAPALFESLKNNLNARDDSSTFQNLIDSSKSLCNAVSDSNMTSVDAAFTTALNGLNSNHFTVSTLAISDMSSVISALSEVATDIKSFNGISTKDTKTILQYVTSVSTNMQNCLQAAVSESKSWSNQTEDLSNAMLTTANTITNILSVVGKQMISHGYCTSTSELSAVSNSIAALNKIIDSTASAFGYTATNVESALDASDLESLVQVSTATITTQSTSLKACIDIVDSIIKRAMVKAFGSIVRRDNSNLTDSINMMVDGVSGYLQTIVALMASSDTSTVVSNSAGLGDVLSSLTSFLASTASYDMTAADYAAIADSVKLVDSILAAMEAAIASSGLNCNAIDGLSSGVAALQSEITSLASNIGFTPSSGTDTCAAPSSSSSSSSSATSTSSSSTSSSSSSTSSSPSSSVVSSNWNTSSSAVPTSSSAATSSPAVTTSSVVTSSTEATTSSTTSTPSSTSSTSSIVAPSTSSTSSSAVVSSTSTSSSTSSSTSTSSTTTTSSVESSSSTSTSASTSSAVSSAVSSSVSPSTQSSSSVASTVSSSSVTATSTVTSSTGVTSGTTQTAVSSTSPTTTAVTTPVTSTTSVSVDCPSNGSVIGTVCFVFTSQYLDTAVSCPKSNGLYYGNSCFYGSSMASSLCTAGYYYSGSCYTPNAGARVAERGNYVFNALAVVLGAFL